MKKIAILGATGSVGRQALDVIEKFPDRFCVTAMTAHHASEELLVLAKKFGAKYIGVTGSPETSSLKKSAQRRTRGLATGAAGIVA